jgi:hypothetical protein
MGGDKNALMVWAVMPGNKLAQREDGEARRSPGRWPWPAAPLTG